MNALTSASSAGQAWKQQHSANRPLDRAAQDGARACWAGCAWACLAAGVHRTRCGGMWHAPSVPCQDTP